MIISLGVRAYKAYKFINKYGGKTGAYARSMFAKGNRLKTAILVGGVAEAINFALDAKGEIKEFTIPNIVSDLDFQEIKSEGNMIPFNDLDEMDKFDYDKDISYLDLAKRVITFTGNNKIASYSYHERMEYLENIKFQGYASRRSKTPALEMEMYGSRIVYLLANLGLKMNVHASGNTIVYSIYSKKDIGMLHDNFDYEMFIHKDISLGMPLGVQNLAYNDSNIRDELYSSGVSTDSINSYYSIVTKKLEVDGNDTCHVNKSKRSSMIRDKDDREGLKDILGYVISGRDKSKYFLPTDLHLNASYRCLDSLSRDMVEVAESSAIKKDDYISLTKKFNYYDKSSKTAGKIETFLLYSRADVLQKCEKINEKHFQYANMTGSSEQEIIRSIGLDLADIDSKIPLVVEKYLIPDYRKEGDIYNIQGIQLLVKSWVDIVKSYASDPLMQLDLIHVLSELSIPLSELRPISSPNWVQIAAMEEGGTLIVDSPFRDKSIMITKVIIKILKGLLIAGNLNPTTSRAIRAASAVTAKFSDNKATIEKVTELVEHLVTSVEKRKRKKVVGQKPPSDEVPYDVDAPTTNEEEPAPRMRREEGAYADLFEDIIKKGGST